MYIMNWDLTPAFKLGHRVTTCINCARNPCGSCRSLLKRKPRKRRNQIPETLGKSCGEPSKMVQKWWSNDLPKLALWIMKDWWKMMKGSPLVLYVEIYYTGSFSGYLRLAMSQVWAQLLHFWCFWHEPTATARFSKWFWIECPILTLWLFNIAMENHHF